MKVLIDICHPAHVHFFKYIIKDLKDNHHQVIVTSRKKKIAEKLLEEENIPFISLGDYKSNIDKILKSIPIVIKLIRILNHFKFGKNDYVMGISPVHASIASKFVKSRCLGFTDTDFAPEQFYIYSLLSNIIFTPKWFPSKVYGAKHIRYEGCHEYNYLNDKYFKPDAEIVKKYGLSLFKYVVIRLIDWDATHDIGKRGITDIDLFLNKLSKKYEIVLTSEYPINNKWKKKIFNGNLRDFHQLLYFSLGYIGEAFTTAQEALVLGKPSIIINPINCFLFEILNSRNELCKKTNDFIEAVNLLDSLVNLEQKRKDEMVSKYCENFVDLNQFLHKFLNI